MTGLQGLCGLLRCAQVCSDSYFLLKSPNKASNSLNIFKVWIFILIFMSLSYFIQLSAFTALHCFDSFFTWSLTKKPQNKRKPVFSVHIRKSVLHHSFFFSPEDHSVLFDCPTKKEIAWQNKRIVFCSYGCLGEEKVQHSINQH